TEDTLSPIILHEFCETGLQNEYRVHALENVQFISKRPDRVEIRYTSLANIDAEVRSEFQRLLNKAGAARTHFDVVRVEHIEPSPKTGKHQLVRFEEAHPIEFHTPLAQTFQVVNRAAVAGDAEQSIPRRFEQQVEK